MLDALPPFVDSECDPAASPAVAPSLRRSFAATPPHSPEVRAGQGEGCCGLSETGSGSCGGTDATGVSLRNIGIAALRQNCGGVGRWLGMARAATQ